jgi:radical SAM protein with 4Fe4S-binding SPASM domain
MRSDVSAILAQMQDLLRALGERLAADDVAATPPFAPAGSPVPGRDGLAEQVYYAPAVTYRVREGVTLALDGERPHWVTTNAAGAMVLRACTGSDTVGEVAERLARRYGIADDDALKDTAAFLENLERIDFVRRSAWPNHPYRGRTSALGLGRLADVYLFVTNDCNLRCTHCYVSSGDYVPPREMHTDEILGLVDQARDLGAGRFLITGGEPFMVRGIFDIIRHITAENDLVILTNGMFFSPKMIARLKDSLGRGRLSLQISLDGPTAEAHDRVRGKGSFAKTVAGIRRVVQAGFEVAVSTAVSRYNLELMADTTRLVGSLGARAHHILWMQEWGRALDHKPELLVGPAQVLEVMRACRAAGDAAGVVIDNDASLRVRVKGKHGRKTDLCSCGWDTLAVFSDGEVYPCVWLAGAPGLECGNILERPLADIWRHSPVLEEIRAASVQNKEKCADCHLKFLCAGGSPCSSHFASMAHQGRSDLRAAEPYCETFLELTHDMLWELGLAGLDGAPAAAAYEPPRLYNAMEGAGAACARPNTKAIDRSFEVGSYHCTCVLESDVAEGMPVSPEAPAGDTDAYPAAESFDAIGRACVELLLPMANRVRALEPGQVLKVMTDDAAAREDLSSWCRMTGNELLDRIKGDGFDNYFIRRGHGP